eukprot:scaffold7918_cov136-Isochrysis_galbana.AAC.4
MMSARQQAHLRAGTQGTNRKRDRSGLDWWCIFNPHSPPGPAMGLPQVSQHPDVLASEGGERDRRFFAHSAIFF